MSSDSQHIDPETGLDTTSFQAMTRGEKYHHTDPYRAHISRRAVELLERINAERDDDARTEMVRGFFKNGSGEEKPRWIVCAPFFCEYVSLGMGSREGSLTYCFLLGSEYQLGSGRVDWGGSDDS
jgi:hypothetical protein